MYTTEKLFEQWHVTHVRVTSKMSNFVLESQSFNFFVCRPATHVSVASIPQQFLWQFAIMLVCSPNHDFAKDKDIFL